MHSFENSEIKLILESNEIDSHQNVLKVDGLNRLAAYLLAGKALVLVFDAFFLL